MDRGLSNVSVPNRSWRFTTHYRYLLYSLWKGEAPSESNRHFIDYLNCGLIDFHQISRILSSLPTSLIQHHNVEIRHAELRSAISDHRLYSFQGRITKILWLNQTKWIFPIRMKKMHMTIQFSCAAMITKWKLPFSRCSMLVFPGFLVILFCIQGIKLSVIEKPIIFGLKQMLLFMAFLKQIGFLVKPFVIHRVDAWRCWVWRPFFYLGTAVTSKSTDNNWILYQWGTGREAKYELYIPMYTSRCQCKVQVRGAQCRQTRFFMSIQRAGELFASSVGTRRCACDWSMRPREN